MDDLNLLICQNYISVLIIFVFVDISVMLSMQNKEFPGTPELISVETFQQLSCPIDTSISFLTDGIEFSLKYIPVIYYCNKAIILLYVIIRTNVTKLESRELPSPEQPTGAPSLVNRDCLFDVQKKIAVLPPYLMVRVDRYECVMEK
jgi:hypothetical protein